MMSILTSLCRRPADGRRVKDVRLRNLSSDRFIRSFMALALGAAAATSQIPGDVAATALPIGSLPFATTGDTSTFNDDYDENCPFIAPGAPDVVYVFTPSTNLILDIDLCGSLYDTKVYVYAGAAPPPGSGPTGLAVACSDDSGCGTNGWMSHISGFAVIPAATYYIVVDGFGGSPIGQSGPYSLVITGTLPPAPAPIDIGSRRQVFFDDRFVAASSGVALTVNPPASIEEDLMIADRPWESGWTGGYSTVVQEGDTVHMWYEPGDASYATRVAYAVSTDRGATWTKPNVGSVSFQGVSSTNLVLDAVHGTHVFLNRRSAAPSERFCLYAGAPNALYTSPDGLNWSALQPVPFLDMGGQSGLDSQNVVFWDRRSGVYTAFPRINVGGPATRRVGRTIATSLAAGFANPPVVVLSPDSADPADSDFYTSAVVAYPWADAYFAFPSVFHHGSDTLDVQFAASHDGVDWKRPDRTPVIGLAAGSQSLYAGQGLSRDGDTVALYFTRYQAPHSGPYVYDGGIGRAVWRLDGFTSMDAGPAVGTFVTGPVIFSGSHLELNVACSQGGSVRVGIEDAAGNSFPGFAITDSDPSSGDSTAAIVTWNGTSSIGSFAGMPIRLRFEMQLAKLHAFQFAGPTLRFEQPGGPSTLRIANRAGHPGHLYFTAVTLDAENRGLYPGAGPWAGLYIGWDELLFETAVVASPFLGWLDSSGDSTWTAPFTVSPALGGVSVHAITRTFDPLMLYLESGVSDVVRFDF